MPCKQNSPNETEDSTENPNGGQDPYLKKPVFMKI